MNINLALDWQSGLLAGSLPDNVFLIICRNFFHCGFMFKLHRLPFGEKHIIVDLHVDIIQHDRGTVNDIPNTCIAELTCGKKHNTDVTVAYNIIPSEI